MHYALTHCTPPGRVTYCGDWETPSPCKGCLENSPTCHEKCERARYVEPEDCSSKPLDAREGLLSIAQIHEATGLPVETVKYRLKRDGHLPAGWMKGFRGKKGLYDLTKDELDALSEDIEIPPGLLTTLEAGKILGRSRQTVRSRIESGRLPAVMYGKKGWRVRAEDVNALKGKTK